MYYNASPKKDERYARRLVMDAEGEGEILKLRRVGMRNLTMVMSVCWVLSWTIKAVRACHVVGLGLLWGVLLPRGKEVNLLMRLRGQKL